MKRIFFLLFFCWEEPDLGPSNYIQLLDEPGNPDNGELQR